MGNSRGSDDIFIELANRDVSLDEIITDNSYEWDDLVLPSINTNEIGKAITNANRIEDLEKRLKAFKHITKSLCNAGEIEKANKFVNGLEDPYDKSELFRNIADFHTRTGENDKANNFYAKAIEFAMETEDYGDFCDQTVLLENITTSLTNAGEIEKAIETFKKIEHKWLVDTDLINNILESLAKDGKYEKILDVTKEHDGLNCISFELENMTKYLLMEETTKANTHFEKAYNTAKKSDNLHNFSDILRFIAISLINKNEDKKANTILEKAISSTNGIHDYKMKSEVLKIIADSLVKVKWTDKALDVYENAIESTENIKDSKNKSEASTSINESLSKISEMKKAQLVYEKVIEKSKKLENSWFKSKVLLGIGESFANSKEIEIANNVYEKAIKTAKSIDINHDSYLEDRNSIEKSFLLISIADSLNQVGNFEKATILFKQVIQFARKNVHELNSYSKIMSSIIDSFIKVGKIEKALNFAQGIKDINSQIELLRNIADYLVKLQRVQEAYNIFENLLGIMNKSILSLTGSFLLEGIAKSISEANNLPNRDKLFEKALDIVEESSTLSEITESISVASNLPNQDKLFEKALSIVDRIEVHTSNSLVFGKNYLQEKLEILSNIIGSLAKTNYIPNRDKLFEKALKIVDEFDVNSWYISTFLCNIIASLIKVGNIEKAENLLERISFKDSMSSIFKHIAESLVEAGDIENAYIFYLRSNMVRKNDIKTIPKNRIMSNIDTDEISAKTSKFEKALELEKEFGYGIRSDENLLKLIAESYIEIGEFEKAIETAKKFNTHLSFKSKSGILKKIAESIVKPINNSTNRSKLLEELIAISYEFKDSEKESKALYDIINPLVNTAKLDEVIILIKNLIEKIKNISSSNDKTSILSYLSSNLTKLEPSLWYILLEWRKSQSSIEHEPLKCMTQVWIKSLSELNSIKPSDNKNKDSKNIDLEVTRQTAKLTLPYILEAMTWLPLDFETAYIGVRAITLNLAKQQEWNILQEVAKVCPQLDLEVLLEMDYSNHLKAY